jgi:hypothetical protein
MEVKFYHNLDHPLWDQMKRQICANIIGYSCGQTTPKFYIHFDKMLYSIGWFVGYVEIWKGKVPYERNKRRIPFTVKVWDWGSARHNFPDYRSRHGHRGCAHPCGWRTRA